MVEYDSVGLRVTAPEKEPNVKGLDLHVGAVSSRRNYPEFQYISLS